MTNTSPSTSPQNRPFFATAQEVYQLLINQGEETLAGRNDPRFLHYYEHFRDPGNGAKLHRFLRQREDVLAPLALHGSRVLEVSCGYGLDSILLSLWGNNSVHTVDWLPSMIKQLQLNCSVAERHFGRSPQVLPTLGEAAHLPLASGYFDLVISMNAIQQYTDVSGFMKEAYRVLKVGGKLCIFDNSAGLNPRRWLKLARGWRFRDEIGSRARRFPGDPDSLFEPFITKRRRIIRDGFPQLDDATVEKLSKGTAGLWRPEILDAVRRYLADGKLPKVRPLYSRLREPDSGVYGARAFNPFELNRQLVRIGFRSKVTPYFYRRPILSLLERYAVFNPITMRIAYTFLIRAEKL